MFEPMALLTPYVLAIAARPNLRRLVAWVGVALLIVATLAAILFASGSFRSSPRTEARTEQIVVTLPAPAQAGGSTTQLVQPIIVKTSGDGGAPLWVSAAAGLGGLLSGLGAVGGILAKKEEEAAASSTFIDVQSLAKLLEEPPLDKGAAQPEQQGRHQPDSDQPDPD